jgi:type VI secretion system secreted protein VgrG
MSSENDGEWPKAEQAARTAAEKVSESVEGEPAAEEVQAAAGAGADAVEAASRTARAVHEVKELVDAVRGGHSAAAVGAGVGALGSASGAVSSIASGVDRFLPAGAVSDTLGRVAEVARTVGDVASAARGPLEQLARWIDDPTKAVRYRVQTDPDPGRGWEVASMRAEEALSEPYRMRVELSTEERDFDLSAILGHNCTLSIERGDDHHRRLVGVICRVDESSPREGEERLRVQLEVVPAFALLALRRDTRVFQQKTVPQVLEEVLTPALSTYGRELTLDLEENYPTREYCLQYDESDLDFVQRLMEEEGIAYFFDHDGDVERLQLVDANRGFPRVRPADGQQTVPFVPRADVVRAQEPVYRFSGTHDTRPTSLVLRDFDWTQQGSQVRLEEAARGEDALGRDREVYEHQSRPSTLYGYDDGVRKYESHDLERQARVRHQLGGRDVRSAQGVSRVTAFTAGQFFDMTGHPSPGADGEYLLTRVVHLAAPLPDAEADQVERYHNTFECLPLGTPFRPSRRTPKPRIHSIQTAVVVGPDGQEIHTDEHGRVKVEFHWDRLGQKNDQSSCWVRVQQPWAGSGWGFVFIPRVGMEVLVSFLDGDPDRPLVIGSVYNGDNTPPYPLPEEKTKSTIKTNSSPGGGGYNELRFEDAKGSEEIFAHAQKDYNEVVEHDHATTVHHDQANTVDGNQTQTIGGKQTETVHGEQSMTVDENRTVHIKGSQNVNIDGGRANGGVSGSKLNITGDYKVDASNWIEVQAPTHIKFTCGGSSILIEPGKITVSAGGHAQVVLDANALVESAAGSRLLLDANSENAASTGSKLKLTANAELTSNAGSGVKLTADAKMGASTGGVVRLTADAAMSGANATVTGTSTAKLGAPTATLAGGGSAAEAGPSGVTVSGTTVDVNGSGTVNVTGGVVKVG